MAYAESFDWAETCCGQNVSPFLKGCLMNELLPLLTEGGWGWIIFKILFLDLLESLIKNNACILVFSHPEAWWHWIWVERGLVQDSTWLGKSISAKQNWAVKPSSTHPTLSDYYLPDFGQSSKDTEMKKPQCLPLRSICPVGEAYV